MRLRDKVVFVTGASGGLGGHFCRAFLREGAKVVGTDITEKMVSAGLAELKAPDSTFGAVVDVCQRSTIEAAVAQAVKRFGRLDILVNVAGGALHTPHKFQEIDDASWDKVVDVNLKGSFLCCQVVVEQFRKQGGGGKVVNVSALAGRWLGSLAGCHYTAAKAGVIGSPVILLMNRGLKASTSTPLHRASPWRANGPWISGKRDLKSTRRRFFQRFH